MPDAYKSVVIFKEELSKNPSNVLTQPEKIDQKCSV